MAAKRQRRVPGFLATSWLFKSKLVFSFDFGLAVVATSLVWFLASDDQINALPETLGPLAVALASTLVGVVVAGLAILVAFPDDDFLALLDEATASHGGVEGQLFPFWFVTGTAVVAILGGLLLIVAGSSLVDLALRATTSLVVGFVVWTVVGVFNLVAWLQATGVSRAIYARRRRPPKG